MKNSKKKPVTQTSVNAQELKEILAIEREKASARRFLENLKDLFPRKSRLQLLPVALNRGGKVAAQILIEEIEHNQLAHMGIEDKIFLQEFKSRLNGNNNSCVKQA